LTIFRIIIDGDLPIKGGVLIKLNNNVRSFASKNISISKNSTYSILVILLVLASSSYEGHSINSKAVSPNADTIFYRINTTIEAMEKQFWKQNITFLREKRRKLERYKCYIVIDETYDSYTGKLLKKEKYHKKNLTKKDKGLLEYIHKYKPSRGDTGSYKYLVIAVVYGNTRRVLRVKALKRKEEYRSFIVDTLITLKTEVNYECALFDRGFYDGKLVSELEQNKIPFIIRARISNTIKKIFGFSLNWKHYENFEIGKTKTKSSLVLGADISQGKRTKWAFITNMKFENWHSVREIYRKRWNIENIFKATDGIQLRAQTSNSTTRMFCVCLSFLLYNAWQTKSKRNITLTNFIMKFVEIILEKILQTTKRIEFYRNKLKINILCWNKIISSR
jgi:hypothetical protein